LLGEYIKALYNYGAMLAGVVAMFMLVFAGWRWLMAAGSAEKISNAKDTISGVLIGLILLFGGYILLSQISVGLVSFNQLALKPLETIASDEQFCAAINNHGWNPSECGSAFATTSPTMKWQIACIDTLCSNEGEACVDKDGLSCQKVLLDANQIFSGQKVECSCVQVACDKLNLWSGCTNIETKFACDNNLCFGRLDSRGEIMNDVCYWSSSEGADGLCRNLDDMTCWGGDNDDCTKYGEPSEDWCCDVSGINTCGKRGDPGVVCSDYN